MAYKQEAVEPLDLDEYFDFNQMGRSDSPSSSAGSNLKFVPAPEQAPSRPRPSLMKPMNPSNVFAGPSHQYDMHKQQTGLPAGGLASTIAANRQSGFHLQQSFPNTNFELQNSNEMFDFNAMPSNPPAFSGMVEMDVDFGSPVDGVSALMDASDFVDPHTLADAASPPRETVRMYPGMHTQQAALAKQRQQQEIQRTQQTTAPVSQPTATIAGNHRRESSQQSTLSSKVTDPVVEERISRLLSQMRNESASENSAASQGNQSHHGKSRKTEEDMDEDERLLASEEGKKLSSKERRQLRNKVSARAFRSRRKEYIGQLEGELTAKAQEADDLRAENEALRSENVRLTDLSKMLLSSPAFSNFLNDLSANGVPGIPQAIANQQQQSMARQMEQRRQQQQERQHLQTSRGQPPKDVAPQQSQQILQQQQSQSSTNATQDTDPDFSNLDINGNWGVAMDFGFDAQVFQVTEIESKPLAEAVFDANFLSGKNTQSKAEVKIDILGIERPGLPKSNGNIKPVVDETIEFNESNPAYALFADEQCLTLVGNRNQTDAGHIFGTIPAAKAFAHISLTISNEGDEAADTTASSCAVDTKIAFLESQLDQLAARVASFLP